MGWIDGTADLITQRGRLLLVCGLLITAGLAVGLGDIEESPSISVEDDSAVAEANGDVRTLFSTTDTNTTRTAIVVREEEDNALSRDSLIRGLEYQQAMRNNETVDSTLADEPFVGIENIVAQEAIAAERAAQGESTRELDPSLDDQLDQLESMNASAVESVTERVVDPDRSAESTNLAYQLLPQEYDAGSTAADARMVIMTQETDTEISAAAEISDEVSTAQATARSLAADGEFGTTHVYGAGLIPYEQDTVIGDSLSLLGPLALLIMLLTLSVAYRDPVDVVLALAGVAVVLVWTLGALGWLGIPFSPVMIVVPILLIGLSVDYALHFVMRYREEREGETAVREAMRRSVVGVGPALVLVTLTTVIGFLANYVSPLSDLRDFGLITAIGITATLAVFCVLLPAAKIEVASLLARVGWDRTPSVPASNGWLRRILSGGSTVANRAPVVLLLLTLVVTGGAAYGATEVELSADQELFMGDPPELTEELPESVAPGDYQLKEDREFVYDNFQSPARQGYVLIEGNVTAPETLERMAAANRTAVDSGVVYESPRGGPDTDSTLAAMERTADTNRTFNETFHEADSDDDGIPDDSLETVYDGFYDAAPDVAAQHVHREDGEYTALRLRIATDGNADRGAVAAMVDDAADEVDSYGPLEATGTGQAVVEEEFNNGLSTTLIESLTLTVVVILVLLMAVFRLKAGSASLGFMTLVPVLISVTWLFGTMALLGIPVSLITAVVGSISVGIGVDYAIHISERFQQERESGANLAVALERTVVGTGSALASSAATTALGFGVLAFAFLPSLQHFGFVLAVGICYSVLTTLYVQPSLLAVWSRRS